MQAVSSRLMPFWSKTGPRASKHGFVHFELALWAGWSRRSEGLIKEAQRQGGRRGDNSMSRGEGSVVKCSEILFVQGGGDTGEGVLVMHRCLSGIARSAHPAGRVREPGTPISLLQ